MSLVPFSGPKKQLSREQAIERYILLRLRVEDINRLGFLVEGLHAGTILLPKDARFSCDDLKDAVRTAFFGWFATLTDKNDKAIYAFDPLLKLFPGKQVQIYKVQLECESCHHMLQQFRNNVAFHNNAEFANQINARRALREQDTSLDLTSARQDFLFLMDELISEESYAIPELPEKLTQLGISHHPAFS
jgi:hypothetical protein